jgi:hypothetical protein
MFQAMQSVKVSNGDLPQYGQAGYIVQDNSTFVNGVAVGKVEVKMDIENKVFEFDVTDIKGL